MSPEQINFSLYEQGQVSEAQTQVASQAAAQTSFVGLSRFLQRRQSSADMLAPTEAPHALDIEVENLDISLTEPEEPETDKSIETHESFNYLNDLLSTDSLQSRKDSLAKMIESNPALSAYKQIEDARSAITKASKKAYHDQDRDLERQLNEEKDRLYIQAQATDLEVRQQYQAIANEMYELDKLKIISLSAGTPVAQKLIAYMQTAPAVQPEPTQPAPFANYAVNTPESWQAVDATAVRSYLEARKFVSHVDSELGRVCITPAKAGELFEVPLSLVVGAADFDSWSGSARTDKSWNSTYGNGEMTSLDVVKHYAALPTELPPVSEMRIIIQPDGKILCDNGEGDSHRIAAAILRGDKTLKVTNLAFKITQQNIV